MQSIEVGNMTTYLVDNMQYRYVLEKLRKENPFQIENLQFRKEGDMVYLCKDGDERPLQPHSAVLKDGSERFAGYDCGDGVGHMLEVLVTAGVEKEEAQKLVDTVYELLPDWLMLPKEVIESMVEEREVPYSVVEGAQAFLEWLDQDEEAEAVEDDKANELETTKQVFHAAYFPMTSVAWNNVFQKARDAGGSFSETVPSCESMTFRMEGEKLFVKSEAFEEKECVTNTDAYAPSWLQGYRLGEGPKDLMSGLVSRGLSAEDAEAVAEQVYSYIDDYVSLPSAEIEKLHSSMKGKVVMIHAGMLNAANEYSKWVTNSRKS
jgi:hypothetical protein